jgi:parvulin-like peptidyl-prolyl isomerase
VRWAHNTEEAETGDVSQPLEFNNKIVVVALQDRRESGKASFEQAKEMIRPDVIREKKVEKFKAEMKGKSIADIASEYSDVKKKRATNVTEKRATLPGGANEPYIVGYALTMTEGNVSEPLKGNKGVYVIELKTKSSVEPRDQYKSYQQELAQNRSNSVNTYTQGVYKALKEKASVKDKRTQAY